MHEQWETSVTTTPDPPGGGLTIPSCRWHRELPPPCIQRRTQQPESGVGRGIMEVEEQGKWGAG